MNQKLYTRSSLAQPLSKVETAAEEANRKLREMKRVAKLKAARVAPTSIKPENNSSQRGNEIDDEILERCTKCPPHRRRRGTFRPLIGNQGEFLCDPCYQQEFPATAFLEETNKSLLKRQGNRIRDKIRNGMTDMLADALGTTDSAHDDMSEASERSFEFPSEIECRFCLEKGVFRRCCSSYYCHPCYYATGTCPGCQKEVPLGIAARPEDPPGKLAVRLSWIISFLIVILTLGSLGLFYWNEVTSPITVFGHSCRGFFPRCDLSVCIDYDGGTGYGASGSGLPAAEPYRECDRVTTSNAVVGSACIVDNEMYAWSDGLIGFDLCVSSPREEQTRPSNVSAANTLLLYAESAGVYVFDDDFELPLRKASAPWREIINGNYSSDCGVNSAPPDRGNHGGYQPVRNKNALVFTGVFNRYAMTEGMNVEHGGTIEFFLKIGPLSNNPNIKCKTAYDGDISLEYCLGDYECIEFALYKVWKYRGHKFQFVSVDIPKEAWSNSTRFKFRQKSFDAARDHWALDDVRIRANLRPGWLHSTEFAERRERSNSDMQRGACCFDTDQCSVFDAKATNFRSTDCERVPEFDSNMSVSRMKSSELHILFCALAFLAKCAYQQVYTHYASRVRRKNCSKSSREEIIAREKFPKMSFHAVTQLTWQYSVSFLLLSTLALLLFRLGSALDGFRCIADPTLCYFDGTFILVSIMALAFDLRAIRTVLVDVLVIEKPLKFVVDLHPDQAMMQIEGKNIPLAEVSALNRRGPSFAWLLSVCYIVAGLPVALGSLTLRSYHLQGTSQVWYTILGMVAILRELFGIPFLAKLFLCLQWILSLDNDDRDCFGRAIRRKGLLQQFVIGASLTSVIGMSTILARRVGNTDATVGLVALIICILFGGFFGVLVGIMHGLPIAPEAYLTCWPREFYCLAYYDRAQCPCLFSCASCAEMNSRSVLMVVSVDEMNSLNNMLCGRLKT